MITGVAVDWVSLAMYRAAPSPSAARGGSVFMHPRIEQRLYERKALRFHKLVKSKEMSSPG